MSDYLSNLIQRSLSATTAILPQTISIFEARPLQDGSSFRGDVAPAPPKVERNTVASSSQEQRTPLRPTPLGSPEEMQTANDESPFPEVTTQAGIESPRQESAEHESGDELEPAEAARESRNAAKTLITPGTLPPNEATKVVAMQKVAAEQPRPAPAAPEGRKLRVKSSTLIKGETKEASAETVPGHNRGASLPSAAAPPPSEVIRVVPAQSPQPRPRATIVPASIVASPRLFAPPTHREETKAEAPSIHVTIGRVEVRATPPAAAPGRAAAAPPRVLSLDKYMRQRAERNRR